MKATITSLGGRAPPGRKRGRLLQDLVGAFKFEVFALEPFQLRAVGRQARALPGIAFSLTDPAAKEFRSTPQLLRDRSNRRPLGRMVVGVLKHHPDRAFTQLGRVPRSSGHGLHPAQKEPSEKAGTIQSRL
jgi:hypothetical protein